MNICSLTESAKKQLDHLCNTNDCYAVSLNIRGGGCAGFEYVWDTIKESSEIMIGDEVLATDNQGKLVIGSHSLMFVVGTEIDYVTSIVGSNFEIKNPNAKSSCGCGTSITFDFDNLDTNVPQW